MIQQHDNAHNDQSDADRLARGEVLLEQVARQDLREQDLDRVIDINFYPIPTADSSNRRWRPVGLGVMGLQDVFFKLNLPFDSPAALDLSISDVCWDQPLLSSQTL